MTGDPVGAPAALTDIRTSLATGDLGTWRSSSTAAVGRSGCGWTEPAARIRVRRPWDASEGAPSPPRPFCAGPASTVGPDRAALALLRRRRPRARSPALACFYGVERRRLARAGRAARRRLGGTLPRSSSTGRYLGPAVPELPLAGDGPGGACASPRARHRAIVDRDGRSGCPFLSATSPPTTARRRRSLSDQIREAAGLAPTSPGRRCTLRCGARAAYARPPGAKSAGGAPAARRRGVVTLPLPRLRYAFDTLRRPAGRPVCGVDVRSARVAELAGMRLPPDAVGRTPRPGPRPATRQPHRGTRMEEHPAVRSRADDLALAPARHARALMRESPTEHGSGTRVMPDGHERRRGSRGPAPAHRLRAHSPVRERERVSAGDPRRSGAVAPAEPARSMSQAALVFTRSPSAG